MADREVVIKIPEEEYKRICQVSKNGKGTALYDWIANGVLLPQGHGRLIDETEADGLIAEGKDGNKAYFGIVNKDWEVIDFLKTVPTVIEADLESEKV